MLLGNEEFLSGLSALFAASREHGNVSTTIKRYDFEGVKQERAKKRAKTETNEAALEVLADRLSLTREFMTLVRATSGAKKQSTLVEAKDLDEFLARLHGILLTSAESIKKKDRLRRKKKAARAHKRQTRKKEPKLK
ncbi:hypothetical protein IWW36_000904 [Coemansia brasiliensis]|uniref:Signal recognition particle subunit SRP14 n=1 Tax=Coemansia brasiliensis TaxID=2650707 RepID=A0A9W8IAB0_9FUNG|nr:hypothetical protein IWW36_000904 [Coemansia brasiliensis]